MFRCCCNHISCSNFETMRDLFSLVVCKAVEDIKRIIEPADEEKLKALMAEFYIFVRDDVEFIYRKLKKSYNTVDKAFRLVQKNMYKGLEKKLAIQDLSFSIAESRKSVISYAYSGAYLAFLTSYFVFIGDDGVRVIHHYDQTYINLMHMMCENKWLSGFDTLGTNLVESYDFENKTHVIQKYNNIFEVLLGSFNK